MIDVKHHRPQAPRWIQPLAVAGLLFAGAAAQAVDPINQLHYPFTDAPGSTTTASDTALNPAAVVAHLTIFNPAGTAQVDLHGAIGSGVNGAVTGIRALDFTPALTPSQTNQPANSTAAVNSAGNAVVAVDLNDSALAAGLGNNGVITSFVATIWIKQGATMLSGSTIGPRLWILNAGAAGVDSGGSANTLGLKFQQNNQVAFQLGADNPTLLGTSPSGAFPANKWLFYAVAYDGTNCVIYYGTDSSAAVSIGSATTLNRSVNLGSAATLAIGNRRSATANPRGLNGWLNDFRFYSGGVPTNTLAFVEAIRQSIAPKLPTVTGVYPDGSSLMQATNTLVFNALSSSGLGLTNVSVVLNGVNVSSSVLFVTNGTPGTATNLSGSYVGLPQQATNIATITATDALGLSGVATVKFDTFSSANFVIEAEEFDYNNGAFIDHPNYTDGDPGGDPNTYWGLDSVELVDTHKGVSTGDNIATDYRYTDGLGGRTQTPAATGELPTPKFAGLLDGSGNPIVNHMVANWSSAEWQNYTKTFPAGTYNVFARLSTASGATIRFDQVTSGQGSDNQTTANLGTFTFSGTSLASFQWVPLLKNGTLAALNLEGVHTVRATSGGGANADMYMFVPANTSLPLISGVYPDGQFLFQATNKLAFTVSSSTTTISTSGVHVSLNGNDVSSSLVFSGGPSTWNVTYTGLVFNQTYNTLIQVTDDNGGSATATVIMDTWNPVFQVEAEDFDFNPSLSPIPSGTGKRYIDNAVPTAPHVLAANSYEGQVGDSNVDEAGPNVANPLTSQPGYSATNYRTNDYTATTIVTDAARRQFAQANALDYNIGFLGPNFWQQYTRAWPSGTYNLYARVASGANLGTIHSSWQQVVAGWGSTNQVTVPLGTFSIPTSGGYSAYLYVPLIDKYGNYAQLTLNGTNTFRAVDLIDPGTFGLNINFYMLTAPRTDLPRIDSVTPDGPMQQGNTFSFVASSPNYGISATGVVVTLNGVNISSNLVLTGSPASWTVSYPGLQPNTAYTATISITDSNNQVHATTVSFDTFNANNYTWEAEDFDFAPENSPVPNGSGLRYIDNPTPTSAPAADSYYGQTGTPDVDESSVFFNVFATYAYRIYDYAPTEVTSDSLRAKYYNARVGQVNPYINDYDVTKITNTAWLNYTRTFPAGSYYVYARLSAGNGAFLLKCSQVTSGFGTAAQTTQYIGSFLGTGASFNTWQYVPLTDTNSHAPLVLTLGGVETLQMTGDNNENVNFFTLVPALPNAPTLTAAISGGNIVLSFQTQNLVKYTVSYKNSLSDATWTPLTGDVTGDGSVKSVQDGLSQSARFYQLTAHN